MKLWILRPIDAKAGAWDPWYDKAFGFVVRAEDAEQARAFAEQDRGDETRDGARPPWMDPLQSTCEELTADGESGVVMQDYHAA